MSIGSVLKSFAALVIGALIWVTPVKAVPSGALQIRNVTVDGKVIAVEPGKQINLGQDPRNIEFNFGPPPDPENAEPLRLRSKLDGFDKEWREGHGEMYVVIRFYNATGDFVAQKTFAEHGDSAGWTGSLQTSKWGHRRESFTVPPGAVCFWVVLSSAGGPDTIGVFIIDDLVVSRLSNSNKAPEALIHSPSPQSFGPDASQAPAGWARDGTKPSMARILEAGRIGLKALALMDDDNLSHAEWHNTRELAPSVRPGDHLLVEWNEMYSVGSGDLRSTAYSSLPPGSYTFRVAEYSILGAPTGAEAMVTTLVPVPYWQSPWFWTLMGAAMVTCSVAGARYLARDKMRRAMIQLEQHRALERERLRIARDIHDDLGARVTEISMFSAMAESNPTFSEKAHDEFRRITAQSRELVAALYETVWAVNPENDNLEAIGNYLRQRINNQCAQAKLRCRLHIAPLPQDVVVSSRVRHNISMAAREAMHNVIKHADASQVTVRMSLANETLSISIEDDGHGFDIATQPSGNGLVNMRQRLDEIGGVCLAESESRRGTKIEFRLRVSAPGEAASNAEANGHAKN